MIHALPAAALKNSRIVLIRLTSQHSEVALGICRTLNDAAPWSRPARFARDFAPMRTRNSGQALHEHERERRPGRAPHWDEWCTDV